MSPAELRSALSELDWSQQECGDALSVSYEQLTRWVHGQKRVRGLVVERIRWHLAQDERERALAASDVPECEVVQRWIPGAGGVDDVDASLVEVAAFERHAQSCAICVAREQFLSERFPPLPAYPMVARYRVLEWLFARVEAVPHVLMPAPAGAVLLAAVVALRAALIQPNAVLTGGGLTDFFVVVSTAAGAGAFGGIVYATVREPSRRLGRAGDYIAGVATVGGYLAALIIVAPVVSGESLGDGPAVWVIWAILSVLFGLVMGHHWFGPKEAR